MDLDQQNAGVNKAEECNESLGLVELWVHDETARSIDHSIDLQLWKAKKWAKKVRPKRSFAHPFSWLVHKILADLEQVFYQTAPSFDESCEIN